LRVAVNTRFLLSGRLEGIGKFTLETVKRMVLQHPETEFIFFFDRAYDPQFIFAENVKPVVINPPARHPILFYIWFEIALASAVKKYKPDVLLSTDGLNSLNCHVPRVTVIHDLAFEQYPQDLGWPVRKYLQYFTPKIAQASERIIAVSEFTKQDIVKTYPVAAEKIDVVYNDASTFFHPAESEAESEHTRAIFSDGMPYFMFVGALHPRKNLVNLFKAFDEFKKVSKSQVKLLIVGRKAWNAKEITETYEQMVYRADVIFTGRVSDEELRQLYSAALCNVYVPYFEGFGIPIVEAQKCNCPVITSNVSSMPEVAGDAAVLVDPFSVNDIAKAMLKVWNEPELRQTLAYLGKQNLKRFSWDKSAEQLWDSLVKAVKSTSVKA
jgi:glycosyltransferase involved in cell wall biosynthesis